MSLILKFHEVTRHQVAAWYQTLAKNEAERRRTFKFYIADLTEQLRESDGLPADAIIDAEEQPPIHYWWFDDIAMVGYRRVVMPPTGLWTSIWNRLLRRKPDVVVTITAWLTTPTRLEGSGFPRR